MLNQNVSVNSGVLRLVFTWILD